MPAVQASYQCLLDKSMPLPPHRLAEVEDFVDVLRERDLGSA